MFWQELTGDEFPAGGWKRRRVCACCRSRALNGMGIICRWARTCLLGVSCAAARQSSNPRLFFPILSTQILEAQHRVGMIALLFTDKRNEFHSYQEK